MNRSICMQKHTLCCTNYSQVHFMNWTSLPKMLLIQRHLILYFALISLYFEFLYLTIACGNSALKHW